MPPLCLHSSKGPALLAVALAVVLSPAVEPAVRADDFQVFCVSNADGTVTCNGWQGGETLTCVGSSGGTSSCTTPSGRSFICVRDSGGVSSCRANGQSALDRPVGTGTQCTFTGDGNFVCAPPPRRIPELLPRPGLGTADPFDQPPVFNPGVDFNLIRPLIP